MADDNNRVELRLALAGRGFATTPERVQELQKQAERVEKLNRPKPEVSFASVLGQTKPVEANVSEKDKRHAALPKKGPKPALAHPGQRETFGRDEVEDEFVVIKG